MYDRRDWTIENEVKVASCYKDDPPLTLAKRGTSCIGDRPPNKTKQNSRLEFLDGDQ